MIAFYMLISFNVRASFYIGLDKPVFIKRWAARLFRCVAAKQDKWISDLLSYFLEQNEPIRTGYIIRPALTFTNQPINALPREIDSEQGGRTTAR